MKDGMINQMLERKELNQTDYFYQIVAINSHEMQTMLSK